VYKLLKSIKILHNYDHKCTATFFMNHSLEWELSLIYKCIS